MSPLDDDGGSKVIQNDTQETDAITGEVEENMDAFFRDLDDNLDDTRFALAEDEEEEDFLNIYNLNPRQRLLYNIRRLGLRLLNEYLALPAWQRYMLILLTILFGALAIVLLVCHQRILRHLVEISDELKEQNTTIIVLVGLLFTVAFPPLIGYSLLSTSTGLLYGVSLKGWFILAVGSIAGSTASFALFKNVLHSRAEKLVHMNRRFEAFASIFQENSSYWLLALLRLCPFPYSLTNGAIAGVYGVSLRNFFIANVMTSPKLVLYLFVGSRVRNLGENTSLKSHIIDITSIMITFILLTLTAWLLYFKTKQRYDQIKRTEDQNLPEPDFEI